MKLRLSNGTEIELTDATYSGDFVVNCKNFTEFYNVWQELTPDNLASCQIVNGENVSALSGVTLTGTQTAMNPDGTLTGHFYYEGNVENIESDYAQAGRILFGDAGEDEDIVKKAEALKSTLDTLKS